MTTRRIRVNNVSYKVTAHEDGTETYDPPLPSSVEAWFARGKQDMAEGHAPKLRTDATFMSGRKSIREQFKGDEAWLNRLDSEYRKQTGMSLPANAAWMGQLAEGQFDARAVVTSQAEVNKLIKRKQEKWERQASAPPVRLAEDIVQSTMQEYRAKGDTSPADELRHKVIETHGAPVA